MSMNKYRHLQKDIRKQKFIEKSCINKKAYNTKQEALKTGNDVYKCSFCKKFHTTTRVKKTINYLRKSK